ncbi:MAG: enoyl-CoA hydratase [Saprospiraceae bacterium]|nr:MAG: enoyl-CoA hydratase [Saprospiraceae bacterium]
MQYENLRVENLDGIVVLTIDREKALNALNTRTIQELKHFFTEQGPATSGLKGVIVTGAGSKAFVAGADIREFLDLNAQSARELAARGQEVFFAIERFHRPVVAAVNGFALGGGCELAMACHLRVAGEHARFGQPEVNLGIIPGYGGTQRLVHLIGKTKALELLMTGDMIDANEALRLGLVNYVVPAGEEVTKARELLEKIASKAPLAIQRVIECVNACFADGVDGFAKEVEAFGETAATEDFKEGVAAFLEKRKAEFKGK